MNFKKKSLSFFLCMMLTVAVALFTTGCNGTTGGTPESTTVETGSTNGEEGSIAEAESAETEVIAESTAAEPTGTETIEESSTEKVESKSADVQVVGEGNKVFALSVVDADGQETLFEIHTDKETVGEALVELKLIDGEEDEFGLYVKTVNGITVDYDKDKKYWAFYVNDVYAQKGVDQTTITEGDSYSLRVE